MSKVIKSLFLADAIIFSFIIPFIFSYIRQDQLIKDFEATATTTGAVIAQATSTLAVPIPFNPVQPATTTPVKKKTVVATAGTSYIPAGHTRPVVYRGPASVTEALNALPKIAICESSNDPLARNKTSSAKGLLQIIDGTWRSFKCEGNVLDAEDNFACGVKIATQSGLHHWSESEHCWNRLIKKDELALNDL